NGYASIWPGNIVSVAQQAVTGWNCNVIRVPLDQDWWFGCSNSHGSTSAAAYQGMVNSIVQFCNNNNAYVLLDLHWSGTYNGTTPTTPCSGSGWGTATGQQPMADANAITFWGSVASAYANNSSVLFDLYNEPFGVSWPTWQSGGVMGTAWTPGMKSLLSAVRSAGATNVCVIGGLNYAKDYSGFGSYPVTGVNVAYAAHLYGNQVGNSVVGWDGYVSPVTAYGPIFVGEFAPSTSCNVDNTTYDSAIFAWIGSPAISGGTAWSMTSGSCPNLLSSGGSYGTSSWGSAVTNWLATPPPNCISTPTPTPTLTPCGYPGNTCTPTDTFTPTDTPTSTPTPYPDIDIPWPNPWDGNQPVTIQHSLSTPADWVHLKVYTLSFRKIYENNNLDNGQTNPFPIYTLSWDQIGNVANGLYYIVIVEKRGRHQTQKVLKLLVRR
ncbi:MAG TPA: cellulase family glycosylhydrolase, partial [bacterium]|nr:cellulase family glycosylhydrolase [bacterium]